MLFSIHVYPWAPVDIYSWPNQEGIQYYERIFGGALQQRTGEDNPFRHIKTKGDFCSDLSFADWDGDGDWDLLVSDLFLPMQYFENDGDGRLSPVDEERNPFRHILQNTTGRRPLMVDWNGDKRMDLLLLPKIWNRLEHADNFIGHKDTFCFAPGIGFWQCLFSRRYLTI